MNDTEALKHQLRKRINQLRQYIEISCRFDTDNKTDIDEWEHEITLANNLLDKLEFSAKKHNIFNIEESLERFSYVRAKMQNESFDYCFRSYSNFEEVEDPVFHELRKDYIESANSLENYVNLQIVNLRKKMDELSD